MNFLLSVLSRTKIYRNTGFLLTQWREYSSGWVRYLVHLSTPGYLTSNMAYLRAPPGAGLTAENPKQKLRSLSRFCQTPSLKTIILICTLPLHTGPHQNLATVCWIPQLLGCASISTFTLLKDRTNNLSEWLVQWFIQQARLFSIAWMPNTKLQDASICKVPNLEVFQKGIQLLFMLYRKNSELIAFI